MRKLGAFILGATLSFAFALIEPKSLTAYANEETVYIGGMPAGFTLTTGGTQVIGVCEVVSEKGVFSPALDAGIQAGDKIVKVNHIQVETIEDLNKLVNNSNGKALNIEIVRKNERKNIEIIPIKDKLSNQYKIGVLVRDSVSGIGTITYITQNGEFGALGHAVMENGNQSSISNGSVFECSIIGVNKGVRGKAGELKGIFLNETILGNAEKLCKYGIVGKTSKNFKLDNLQKIPASSNSVKPGEAYIYSTINGVCPKRYNIEIVKVDKHNKDNKNYVIKIVDEDLISETGGIVQGMSGSPIVQEGKLVGAITHVFLNDPTRGYGIEIETMLQK